MDCPIQLFFKPLFHAIYSKQYVGSVVMTTHIMVCNITKRTKIVHGLLIEVT